MMGMYDTSCTACRRAIGWSGERRNQPRCACGHRPSQEWLDAEQARLEEIHRLVNTPCEEADAAQLREQRRLSGLSVGQAAREAGIDATLIRGFEAGTAEPTPEEARKLSEAYGVGGAG